MIKSGSIFTTNEGCICEVIEYESSGRVRIKFLDVHGFEKIVTATNIRNGEIKNPYHPSVCGVGFFGVGKFKAKENDKQTYTYTKWKGMLVRAYDEQTKIRQPAYAQCSVVEEWYNYQIFSEWLSNQRGYLRKNWHLDKDLMANGGKIYGPNSCILVPQEINNLLTGANPNNGLPRGVCWHKGKSEYISQCRVGGVIKHLGYYDNIEEASHAYVMFKKSVLKLTAMKYYGEIDDRLFELLCDYPAAAIT